MSENRSQSKSLRPGQAVKAATSEATPKLVSNTKQCDRMFETQK